MNSLANLSDDELVEQHSQQGVNTHFVSEMLRRLMLSLAAQHDATTILTKRIKSLTAWLLYFTIALVVLTVLLLANDLGFLARFHR